jgi:CRP-like cAMP-binding protein
MLTSTLAQTARIEHEAAAPKVPLHHLTAVLAARRSRRQRRSATSTAVDRLISRPQFRGIDERVLAVIGQHADLVTVDEGTVLEVEGSHSHQAVFIVSGEASVSRSSETVGSRSPGDVVGAGAILAGRPSTYTTVAITPVEAVVLHAAALSAAVRLCPELAGRLGDGEAAHLLRPETATEPAIARAA